MDIEIDEEENEMRDLAEHLVEPILNEEDVVMEELLEENPINPILLIPVIRCVLKFLNIEDIKNCRQICSEWDSTGMHSLANRSLIHFSKNRLDRFPANFYSDFENSSTLFSAFVINGKISKEKSDHNSWTLEELNLFFKEQQSYIKELELELEEDHSEASIMKNVDISAWISKSPMVQNSAKCISNLTIGSTLLDIPISLLAHIKQLNLTDSRIIVDEKMKMCPIKFKLDEVAFYQDGVELYHVLINDFVDLTDAKEISLRCVGTRVKYVLDFDGNTNLDTLKLEGSEILNGEISQWTINFLETVCVPYSFNSQMEMRSIHLFDPDTVSIDLSSLPNSVEMLKIVTIDDSSSVTCSQPIVLKNLKFLKVQTRNDYLFLSHFANCPQLSHLQLIGPPGTGHEIKSNWMPRSLKTLILTSCSINWIGDGYLNLEKLVLIGWSATYAAEMCNPKIRVEEFIVCFDQPMKTVQNDFIEFLRRQRNLGFGKKFFVGEFNWEEERVEESLLSGYVDEQASYYVFEIGKKGCGIPKEFINSFLNEIL